MSSLLDDAATDVSWAVADARDSAVDAARPTEPDTSDDRGEPEQTPTPAEFARLLRQAVDAGDAVSAGVLLEVLLDPERVPLHAFRRVLKHVGGDDAMRGLVDGFLRARGDVSRDLLDVAAGRGTVITRLERRLNFDRPPEGSFDAIEAVELVGELAPLGGVGVAAVAAGPLAPVVALGGTFALVKPYLDEVTATAKKFWDDLANELADSGNIVLATAVSLVRDVLTPGSSWELLITFVPWGRIGVLAKALLVKAAAVVGARLAGTGLPRVAAALMRYVDDFVRAYISPLLDRFSNALADRMVGVMNGRTKQQVLHELAVVLQKLTRSPLAKGPLDDILAQRAKKRVLNQADIDDLTEAITQSFGPPPPGVSFQVLPDGSVLQVIETTLQTNTAGRAVPNLGALAERHGLIAAAREHWGHIISSIRSGDDAIYNLLRTDGRINTSHMKIMFDELPAGLRVEARVLFDTVEACMQRVASHLEFQAVGSGGRQFIGGLSNLTDMPELTLAALRREAIRAASNISPADLDDEALRLIQMLARVFDL